MGAVVHRAQTSAKRLANAFIGSLARRVSLADVAGRRNGARGFASQRIKPAHPSEQAREPEQGVAIWGCDPDTLTDFTYRADECVELERTQRFDILQHGGLEGAEL